MTASSTPDARLEAVDYDPFAGAVLSQVVPTTEPQREVWLAGNLGKEASLAFNESISLRFRGALDVVAMQKALLELAQRHEVLRSTIGRNGEELLIGADATANTVVNDYAGLAPIDRDAAIDNARRRAVETPFDLEHGPLLRSEILRLQADEHLLILTAHHIVCDGWSFGVLVHDLAALYAKCSGVRTEALPAVTSFGEYAAAHQAFAGSDAMHADEAYWLSAFAGAIPVLDLPVDGARPAWRTFTSRREDYLLDASLVESVRKAGARIGASLFASLLSGFAATLCRISGATDIVIGVPAAGQSADGLGGLVGHCVNLLPLRLRINPAAPAREMIAATQSTLLDAYEHQGLTFGSLLKKLSIPRDTSRLPLVNVMFNIDQALDANSAGFPGLDAELSSNPRSFENFELFVNAVQVGGALRLECQYNSDLFDSATMRRWLTCFEMLLRSTCASIESPVGKLAIVSAADMSLMNQWNDTVASFSNNALIHELFESQVKRVADNVAVVFRGASLTYSALDSKANRIAHILRQRGVKRGSLVGLHVNRGPDMIAAMLAVLKAGAAYVPLDPSYPHERLAFMAEDADLVLMVTEDAVAQRFAWPIEKTLCLDRDAATIAGAPSARLDGDADTAMPGDRAYVIYTSGSTGKPKGVEIAHRSVVNFLQTMARSPGLDEADRMVAVTTLSFDIAVNEILLPLSVGAGVVLADQEETGDGWQLARLILESGANVMQATPATWQLLIEAGWNGRVDFKALCGGEALAADMARRLLERTGALWNMYGPTETTVWSTASRIANVGRTISIGAPIANTTIWVLDEHCQACPIGVPGEIWIGGEGVALGYLNRPELTSERFIPDPFSSMQGARLYRTGDRGRWCADGKLEHLGRLDFQVKVRGYRIELGEIEAVLATYPGVQQIVVIAREDSPGDVRIVAYAVPVAGVTLQAQEMRAYLKATLPDYMVPQHFVTIAKVPLLPNGKVQRSALPRVQENSSGDREVVAPRNDLEKLLLAEMEASLGLPGLGIHDDFFALGGHSLLAAQLSVRLCRSQQLSITMRDVFAAPTVAHLAAHIHSGASTASRQPAMRIPHIDSRREAPMSVLQEPIWYLEQLYPGRVIYNTPSAHRLTGKLNERAFEHAFRDIVIRQAALRTCFEQRGGHAVQIIRDDIDVALFPAEDLSLLTDSDRTQVLEQRLGELAGETFDLALAPLFSARMFRLSNDEHVLFFMTHHIVWDGWSFDLFYDEISALYAAHLENRPNPLPVLGVTYGDFSAWQQDWMHGPEFARQLAYWRGRLKSADQIEKLPCDLPRPVEMSGEGKTQWITIDLPRTSALHELSKRCGTTLFVTSLALFYLVLYDYSRSLKQIVSTPVRGRDSPGLERIMGFFTVLLPLQLDIVPSERFIEFVDRVKAMVIESFASPDVPQEIAARELPFVRRPGGNDFLSQALFSFQDARQRARNWSGLRHEFLPLFQRGTTHDIGMWFLESVEGLTGGVTYNTDIILDETAVALKSRYLALLDAVLAEPEMTVEMLHRTSGSANATAPDSVQCKSTVDTAPVAIHKAQFEPQSETEKLLADIWREQLNVTQIKKDDNFFDLGGHSLLAMQAILAMAAKTGKRIDRGRYIFESLGQIAQAYDDAKPEEPPKRGRLRGLLTGILGVKNS